MASFLDSLSNLSEDELRADLRRIEQQREQLELQEGVLRLALDLARARRPAKDVERGAAEVEPSSARGSRADAVIASTSRNGQKEVLVTALEVKTSPRPASKRGPIKSIMRGDPDREWTAPEIHAELERRGFPISKPNTRVTLRRMARASELDKVGEGRYRLPSATTTLLSEDDDEN